MVSERNITERMVERLDKQERKGAYGKSPAHLEQHCLAKGNG